MTYIIAEPCIDIKDRSCVDVCPVDCIHEADRILVIDPEECIDCFPPGERFLTTHGLRTFAELEDQPVRVLTDDGFRPALVKRFRRRPLVAIDFAPAFEERDRYGGWRLTTRDGSRYRRTISATPTHSWILADGERTGSLEPGQFVPAMRHRPKRDGESYRLGVLHGLVYGDGTWGRRHVRSGDHVHEVALLGERVARFRDFFDEVEFERGFAVHPGYAGTGVVRAGVDLKRALPETGDTEYVAGFVDGWLAADGDATRAGSWRLRATDRAALAWLEAVAPYAGFVTVGSGQDGSRETSFGVRNRPVRWLDLAARDTYWQALSVTEVEADAEDTFCAVVPEKHAFTLAGGVYVGNCGACEPECPVEAIFPEDALPEKWDAFVKINYAYGEGMDVVNRLTDEYATEHNVQNPPLE